MIATSLFVASNADATDGAYLETLIDRAAKTELAADPGWRALGHYRPDWFNKHQRSLILGLLGVEFEEGPIRYFFS